MKKPNIEDYREDADFPHKYIKDHEIWEAVQDELFEEIFREYKYGDVGKVKDTVRQMEKDQRKDLYVWVMRVRTDDIDHHDSDFFFNLI